MALRETVELDIRQAQQQINLLESQLNQASTVIDVPVEIEGQQALRLFEQQVESIDAEVVVEADTFNVESKLENVRRQLGLAEGSAREFGTSFEGLDDNLQRIASSLGVSEDEARRLAREIGVAQIDSTRLDRDMREVARAMGLSEAEASRFVRQLQRAENEAEDVQRQTDRISGSFRQLRTLAGGVLAGFGIREVAQQFQAAIDSATALEESMNAVNVVFGEGGRVIEEFGRTSAESVGLAASNLNELVTPIGALLQNFGLEGREAADAALELTTRAADLASIFDTDVSEALTAIGSALRGEQEPIRRFGVTLDAASADAKALELGLVGVGEEVSLAARGQANYVLLLEQTAFAAGDFARTADSAANRQKVLTEQLEEARAEIGGALLPLFEQMLDVVPEAIDALSDLGPVIELAGSLASGAVEGWGNFAEILGDAAGLFGDLTEAINDLPTDHPLFELLFGLQQDALTSGGAIGFFATQVDDLRDVIGRGFTDSDLEAFLDNLNERAALGADPLVELGRAFASIRDEGVDVVPILTDIAGSLGVADDDLASFVSGLISSRSSLQLTESELRGLRDILASLFQTGTTGEGLNFERQGAGARELAEDLGLIAEAAPLSAEGIEFLDEAFEGVDFQALVDDFPVVIRDLEDLRIAAEEAGVSTTDFVNNLPDNVTLDLSAAELEILGLIEELDTLDQRLAEFQPENVIDLSDFINEDTGQIDASLADIRGAINEQLGEEADFQLDLSQIALVAPDVAAILEAEGVDIAGDLAASLAADLEEAGNQQALIDGTAGLAATTAEQYAEFLKDLTPEELQRVAAFGPQNLIPALRDQLVSTGQEMAEILDTTLGETTIAPELTIDLANIIFQNLPELTFDVSATGTSSTGTGTDTGTGGTAPPPPPVQVVIQNATTEDITTSATQAGQIVGAVSTLLPRAQ